MKKAILFSLLLFPRFVFAAEHHADSSHIPWHTIGWQVFNLTILLAILGYLVSRPLKNLFVQRRAVYLETEQKSQKARELAEREYIEISQKLASLRSTKDESISRAQAEAVDMKKQMIKDADEAAARIKSEAKNNIEVELLRAQREVRDQFIQKSMDAARTVLQKDIGAGDQQKLQQNFIDNLQAGLR